MPSPRCLPLLAAAALLNLSPVTHGQDGRDDWPEGSAMHALYIENDLLQANREALDAAHAGLLAALDNNPDDPSPLARAVASQHAQWLAYRHADCQLAGTLTGAGGAWPSVHAISCEKELVAERIGAVSSASACLQQLPAESARYEQLECLQGLVAWSMDGN